MNKVILSGRLTSDPAIRYTQDGRPIASFRLAVTEGYGDKKRTDFIGCKSFGTGAEFVQRNAFKGQEVMVCGKWQTGEYEKDGHKVYTNEVSVSEFQPVTWKGQEERKEQKEAPQAAEFVPVQGSIDDQDLPF